MKYSSIIANATSIDEVVEYINENQDEASEIAAQYALQATDEDARDWDDLSDASIDGGLVSQLECLADAGAAFTSTDALKIAQQYAPQIDFGAI